MALHTKLKLFVMLFDYVVINRHELSLLINSFSKIIKTSFSICLLITRNPYLAIISDKHYPMARIYRGGTKVAFL